MEVKIERTTSGKAAMWEKGGSYSNTGYAQIIAGVYGEKIKPVYVKQRGSLACNEHALISITRGSYIILADHHRGDFEIVVYQISNIENESAVVSVVYSYNRGEWDKVLPCYLRDAIKTAKGKALTYHCREPQYIA